jgi:hypothetical protein
LKLRVKRFNAEERAIMELSPGAWPACAVTTRNVHASRVSRCIGSNCVARPVRTGDEQGLAFARVEATQALGESFRCATCWYLWIQARV